ncbi:meiotic nuclear division protein 1 homolog [Nilaparvata lugens]|uniref:meiotic nuclear division protein 1 homolog n=1 Tax=Nilaparvata lugens TaxID=108931 RepID=UPI00193E1E47|nr:meiotic nuclear division protein 1 homolog [Nilaparvata lugens]XP_022190234.2 meiotic nuclear division protein 1 homolog [Nilaparvata lugens]
MSKKKGVSADEKRNRILQLFYEKKDFFNLKEVEKIGQKEKGVKSQYIKDIVQNLVADGLVDSDKIGTSIYYWSDPRKAINAKKRSLSDIENKLEECNKRLKKSKDGLLDAKIGREETPERATLMKRLSELEEEELAVNKEWEKYKHADPKLLEIMTEEVKVAKDAINRWTENIILTKSWCKNKFGIDEKTLDKQFSIPEDFDYI